MVRLELVSHGSVLSPIQRAAVGMNPINAVEIVSMSPPATTRDSARKHGRASQRASHACDNCRKRKGKCRPTPSSEKCEHCESFDVPCTFLSPGLGRGIRRKRRHSRPQECVSANPTGPRSPAGPNLPCYTPPAIDCYGMFVSSVGQLVAAPEDRLPAVSSHGEPRFLHAAEALMGPSAASSSDDGHQGECAGRAGSQPHTPYPSILSAHSAQPELSLRLIQASVLLSKRPPFTPLC